MKKRVLIAGSGGHLMQLYMLSHRMKDQNHLWVVDRTPQSESLLEGKDVFFLPYRAPRDVIGVIVNGFLLWKRVRSEQISGFYSTGAGLALSGLIAAILTGGKLTYVESATRVSDLSLTGRLLNNIPNVARYIQYPHRANFRWKYAFSVFDSFAVTPINSGPVDRKLKILVTVGANKGIGFRRLVEAVHRVINSNTEVFIQYGPTDMTGIDFDGSSTLSAKELAAKIDEADVVIAHAGTGSALAALKAGKFPLLVPRSAAYGEHVDDHQQDLARFLEERGLAHVRKPEELASTDFYFVADHKVVSQKDLGFIDI